MNKSRRILFILSTLMIHLPAYADGFDSSCVNECLKTKHECHYCAYQCRTNGEADVLDLPEREYNCPLAGFEN